MFVFASKKKNKSRTLQAKKEHSLFINDLRANIANFVRTYKEVKRCGKGATLSRELVLGGAGLMRGEAQR